MKAPRSVPSTVLWKKHPLLGTGSEWKASAVSPLREGPTFESHGLLPDAAAADPRAASLRDASPGVALEVAGNVYSGPQARSPSPLPSWRQLHWCTRAAEGTREYPSLEVQRSVSSRANDGAGGEEDGWSTQA